MAVDFKKLIDADLLAYFKSKLDLLFTQKVDKVDGKGLSTNDYTAEEKTKLAGIATGAQVNVLEGVQVNGATVTPTNKIANIPVPVKTSDITNDSGFITAGDIPAGVQPSSTTPKADGTAATGTETKYARGDHVHPSDNTKVDKVSGKGLSTNDYTTDEKTKLAGIAAGAQVNVLEGVQVNGDTITPANKLVNISVPTLGSSDNGNGYVKYSEYSSALANAGETLSMLSQILGTKANANNVYEKSEVYNKTEIDQKLAGAMNYKGTKATTAALPTSGNVQGDVWHVTADGSEWAWNGSAWEELGTAVDLSGYVEESDLGLATTDDIDALFA